MKKTVVALFLGIILAAFNAHAAEPVEAPKACELCRMDRTMFAHSRMIVTYDDGTSTGTCSIHCVAADLKKQGGKPVKSFRVADYNTKELTDAKSATWVMGGKKKGVMTGVPKWAFAKKSDAQAFVKEFGGKITPFEKILRASKDEVAENARGMGH